MDDTLVYLIFESFSGLVGLSLFISRFFKFSRKTISILGILFIISEFLVFLCLGYIDWFVTILNRKLKIKRKRKNWRELSNEVFQ